MEKRKYAGTWTAIVTPFKNDGSLDEGAFRGLVKRQIDAGITGIVPAGTTGESPTLSLAEMKRIYEIAVEEAKGKAMVMAGTGSNSTAHALEYTKAAIEAGADCCLVVTPYYNKPTPNGLKAHFRAIADLGLPVIIYNIKGRTALNIETDTMMKLAEHPNIVGVKEASGDIEQIRDVITRRPNDFTVLGGDDNMTFRLMEAGGDGVVSVASNIVPGKIVQMVNYALDGNFEEAGNIDSELQEMFAKIFVETNPIPVKYCLYKMGLCELAYRLPMCEPTQKSKEVLDEMISKYDLI
ncbi:MAG: 4-hydroxy-tetrahydrodipicolinate synthase [Candidatus Spechtbacteria bacterium]|nr:4-hydroxy-tetrahydrodipicolinate synthase [Candidatus Spechtbacteria bacterium]